MIPEKFSRAAESGTPSVSIYGFFSTERRYKAVMH